MALGDQSYVQWAVNLAASVKFYSPQLHITLIHDGCINYLIEEEKTVFDHDVVMSKGHYCTDTFQPGLAKLSLYEYFQHEQSIFIDADSICIDSIEGLFDACANVDIGLQVYNVASTEQEWECVWASWDQLKELYGIDGPLSEINSSFIYSKKNPQAESFWKQAKANFINNLQTLWADKFPDELAFDVATNQTGISGKFEGCGNHYPVSMTSRINGRNMGVEDLKSICPIISFWGGKKPSMAYHYKNYDLQANRIHREVFGKTNPYKHQRLMEKKLVHKAGQRLLKQSLLR